MMTGRPGMPLPVRTMLVALNPPQHRGAEPRPRPTVTAVVAREEHPPDDREPIAWMLRTTLAGKTWAEAATGLRWYASRWRIERYPYVLKSGGPVEALPLATRERVERALAVYRMVAGRLLGLTYGVRERPDEPCTRVLRPVEWEALYAAPTRTADVPDTPIDLYTAVRWIAQRGGFWARRHDGEPGVNVLWRGYQRLQDLTAMGEVLHPPESYG